MRFSTAAAIAGLPLLATAQDVPGYQAQFQNYLDKFMAYLPNPSKPDAAKPAAQAVPEAAAPAAEVPIPEVEVTALTLENWKDVLYSHVAPESTTPEPTWVFITGGNKTCFGKLLHALNSGFCRGWESGGANYHPRPLRTG